jgi:hypothetical protein
MADGQRRVMGCYPLLWWFLAMTHICIVCLAPFVRVGKSRRKTCSKSCQSALAWTTNPEKRIEGIRQSKLRPDQQEILRRTNAKRWNDPAQHGYLRALNRERWANRREKQEWSRAIRRGWNGNNRAALAAKKREWWATKSAEERRQMIQPAIEARRKEPTP